MSVPILPKVTLRLDRPDGTVDLIVREPSGRITATRQDHLGTLTDQVVGEFDEGRGYVMHRVGAAGGEPVLVEPTSTDSRVSVYGMAVERAEYPGAVVVERHFDDDGRLREVQVQWGWGEQTLVLRTDGSRSMRWRTPLEHGEQSWDASGTMTRGDVQLYDGTVAAV